MDLYVRPEEPRPVPDAEPLPDFMSVLGAASTTARMLLDAGLQVLPDEDDLDYAASVVRTAAADPENLKPAAVLEGTPAGVLMVRQILDTYGVHIAAEADRIRNLVVNRLVLETENPDARIRVRALELLGRMTEVGLFTDRREVTISHAPVDEARQRLRERLSALLSRVEDAETADPAEPADPAPAAEPAGAPVAE